MGRDVTIDASELRKLGLRLKVEGNGALRLELLRGIRAAAKPAIPHVRASAESVLPRRGGLAARVAGSKIGVRTRLSASSATVRLQGDNSIQLTGLDRGRLRHPVFGTPTWVGQSVTPGWFSTPMQRETPAIRRKVAETVGDVTRQLARRL